MTEDYLKGHPDAPFQDPRTAGEHMANAMFLSQKAARHQRRAAWWLVIVGFGIILSITARLLTQ
jgi:hypothetical protein